MTSSGGPRRDCGACRDRSGLDRHGHLGAGAHDRRRVEHRVGWAVSFTAHGIAAIAKSCGIDSVELIEARPFHVAIVLYAQSADGPRLAAAKSRIEACCPAYVDVRILVATSLVDGLPWRQKLALAAMRVAAWWVRVQRRLRFWGVS